MKSKLMDDKTTALIQQLAERLGTTTEHLWGVLVRQAPISGTVDLLAMGGFVFVTYWLFRLLLRKTKQWKDDHVPDAPFLEVVLWAGWALLAVFTTVFLAVDAANVVAAFVNPEYWALMQLVGHR